MLLATASSAVMSAVAHLATVAPSREWNAQTAECVHQSFLHCDLL